MSNGRKLADLMVGTNVVATNVDSDLSTKISSIKTRLDSDDTKLQSLDTAIQAGIQNLADSDLIINQLQAKINSVISNVDSDSSFVQSINTQIDLIKTRLDSDDAKLQQVRTSIASEISATNTDISSIIGRLDSDSSKLQQLDTSIVSVKSRLDSDDAAIQAATTLASATAGSVGVTDSDLKVVADLRNQLDSEILFVKNFAVSYTSYLYNATAGQTSFTGTDANSLTLAYTAGSIQVFLNGIRLEADDYTATDGAAVVLTEGSQLGHQVTIVVPKLASNPVSYGPVWTSLSQQAKLVASDAGTNDFFGVSVDIKGDYAVVGARGERAAYVFTRSGTTWTQQAKLTPSSSTSNFGLYVAMSTDTNYLIVGSPFYGTGGGGFIFVRSGTSWSQQTILVDSGVASSEEWTRVAISSDGTYAVVGSIRPNSYRGRATVFVRSGTSWSQQTQFNGAAASDYFGVSVGISDDGATFAAAAQLEGPDNKGAVYVSTRSSTTWSSMTKLVSSDAGGSDYLGGGTKGVDINEDGTLIVAGAYAHNTGGVGNSGAAYIFKYSGSSWSQVAKLTPPSNVLNQGFAHQVAISGNTVAIGYHDTVANLSTANAHVYTTEDESTWTLAKTYTASDIASGMSFGHGLNIDEAGTILVGASGTANTSTSPGAAYVFTA